MNSNPTIIDYLKSQNSNQAINSVTGQQNINPNSAIASYLAEQNGQPDPLDDTAVKAGEGDTGDQSYNNYCEAFAEQLAYGHQGIFPTAQSAWNAYAQQGNAVATNQIDQAPAGSLIYFQSDRSNSYAGHVGVSDGKGDLISATSSGVKTLPVSEWITTTGQKPLGFVIVKGNQNQQSVLSQQTIQQPQQPLQQAAPQVFNFNGNPNG